MAVGNKKNEDEKKEDQQSQAVREENTWKKANFMSKMFFTWVMPLFWKGKYKTLNISDVSKPADEDISENITDKLEKNWNIEIESSVVKGKKPSFLKALSKTFASKNILTGILTLINWNVCRAFQPILLALLIDYFTVNSTTSREMAYVYASGLVILVFLNIFLIHHVTMISQRIGMQVRIACCSLLYRKILRLNHHSLNKTTTGQIINLMSNDVNRFDLVFLFIHSIWILPFHVIIVCYLIYINIGMAALVGVISISIQTLPVQAYLTKLSSKYREIIAIRTDERVRIMNEVIAGIQVIKMYAWEKPFEMVVSMARASEISPITKSSYIKGTYQAFIVFTERFTLYVTLVAYTLMGFRLSSAIVFLLAQFYNTLQSIMAISYPMALLSVGECWITIKRLEDFLLMDENKELKPDTKKYFNPNIIKSKHPKENQEIYTFGKHTTIDTEGIGFSNLGFIEENDDASPQTVKYNVKIDNVTAAWNAEQIALENISLKVSKGSLCAIIGAVGAGKSTVLKLLIKELSVSSGSFSMDGTFSYASQEPWLFVASVRNNILFGLPFDLKKYREVVRVCALEEDFKQFPKGDQTLVGERGVSLSGGQKARINLARAVYRDSDIYLLDDPLSAVDAHVGQHLFEDCISTYLKGKTVILVTHQLHYLHTVDSIVIMKNGRFESQGTYNQLANSGQEFANLLVSLRETNTEMDGETSDPHKKKEILRRVSQLSISSLNKNDYNEDDIAEEMVEEEQLKGKLNINLFYKYYKASGNWPFFFFMVLVMLLGQLSASLSDYWVTYWTNQQSMFDSQIIFNNMYIQNQTYVDYNSSSNILYLNYNKSSGNHSFDLEEKIGPFTSLEYLYIYSVIIGCCVITTLSRSALFFKVSMNASKGLHNHMFHKILKGVMRFFDTNPSGRILNRFSKDIGAVDELLPKALMEAVQIFLVMTSILILVSIANYWMVIPAVILFSLFVYIFTLYLYTAMDIKRLEGITKSPVFSHVTATYNGITTIRACGVSNRFIVEFDKYQDLHTSTWYQYLSCSNALGFWLDFICSIFIAIVSFSFILFKSDSALAGNVGLAISQSLILTGMLQFGVRQSAEVVSQMTSVERILQYDNIENEKNLDEGEIPTPKQWPNDGVVKFEHMYLKYNETDPPVLKDLNVTFESGWKVGIVGRTGAGKSSLIAALFRLSNIEGSIQIDGIDTSLVSLQDLREKISIIPQEPVLFSATMRYNLDPFSMYEDADLWNALEYVELKDAVTSLDYKVSEGGSNFSIGQRQLICLARAILRNNKILVLDEATANVDPQTDSFIQQTIRVKFRECTVLTIAHRLNTIMDSDRVLVMDTGRAAEFDHPYILLSNPEGHLSQMVSKTGNEMSKMLYMMAKEAYIASGNIPFEYDLDNSVKTDSESNKSLKYD